MALSDPERAYFLDSDRAALTDKFGPPLRDQLLQRGDMGASREIAMVLRRRIPERLAWMDDVLAAPLAFDASETYPAAPRATTWMADRAKADEAWRRRLKAEVLEELLNDVPASRASANVRRRYGRFAAAVDRMSPDFLSGLLLRAVARLYDPASDYYTAQSMAQFGAEPTDVGIGLLFNEHHGATVIQEVLRGGPADRSGKVSVGDRLLAVGQGESDPESIVGRNLFQVTDLTKGAPGSRVRVILRPRFALDPAERTEVTLLRAAVSHSTRVRVGLVKGDSGAAPIGLVQIPSFYGEVPTPAGSTTSASADLDRALGELKQRGVAAVVLDLRGNGGGYLKEAVHSAGLFLGATVIAHLRHYDGTIKQEQSTRGKPVYEGPLVILTDRVTASGAELVAGALQAYGRALIRDAPATHCACARARGSPSARCTWSCATADARNWKRAWPSRTMARSSTPRRARRRAARRWSPKSRCATPTASGSRAACLCWPRLLAPAAPPSASES